MKKQLLILVVLISILFSCNNKQQTRSDDEIKVKIPEYLSPIGDQVVDWLKYIIEWENTNKQEPYEMQAEDVRLGALVYHNYLKHKKMKFVDDAKFNSRVLDFFGIDITQVESGPYPNCIIYELPYSQSIWICKDQKILIFRTPYLGRVFALNNDDEWIVDIPEFEYHYNNFILNESDASLTWLIQNQMANLCGYVKELGYDKNEKLTKEVLQFYYTQYKDKNLSYGKFAIHNLFASHRCTTDLDIREKYMQAIVDMTTFDDNKYLKWMSNDIGYLLGGIISGIYEDENSLFTTFTMDEKLKILAYICYYVEQGYIKNGVDYANHEAEPTWLRRSLLSFELKSTPQLLEALEKNNYYNLPNYKKIVEDHLQLAEELGWR